MKPQIAPRTVVEAFLPSEGEAALADIYNTANLVGIDDQPIRLAIRRLITAGDVTQLGRGRAGTLRLTRSGRDRLQRDRRSLALAFAQDAGEIRWDGRWRLIAASVPERYRSVRDAIRRELVELGAVAISTGLYISPHDLLDSLPLESHPYLTTATTEELNYQGVVAPLAIAEALWPSGPIVAAYAAITDTLREIVLNDSVDGTVRQLHLADALERAMRHDPLIPLELRTGQWTPQAIRAEWATQWELHRELGGRLLYQGW